MREEGAFKFTWGERRLIRQYCRNPEQFTVQKTVVVRGRRRKIVTYAHSPDGRRLRRLHARIHAFLCAQMPRSRTSYAYRRGTSALDCVRAHLGNDLFFKTDVHRFFDSVDPEIMRRLLTLACGGLNAVRLSEVTGEVRAPFRRRKFAGRMVRACFFRGRLPIGFVSSPALSDLYLYLCDRAMEECGALYTRYADDILISVKGRRSVQRLADAQELLARSLRQLGLELNRRKTFTRELKQPGDALHFLGVNLVRRAEFPLEVTVGDRYLRETCRLYCRSLAGDCSKEERAELAGRVQYVAHVSAAGREKLARMCRVKSGGKSPYDPPENGGSCSGFKQ